MEPLFYLYSPSTDINTTGEYDSMADAAQEAEYLHTTTGRSVQVIAKANDPFGMYLKGDAVYTSQG